MSKSVIAHPALAARPNPRAIFNFSTVTGPFGEMLNKPNLPGVASYTIPRPVPPPGAIFVEAAPTPMRRRFQAVVGSAVVASITVGITLALAFIGSGFVWSDFLLGVAVSITCGAAVGLLMLWISEVLRRFMPWAVVIQQAHEDVVVRLAFRSPWCCLADLSPSIAVGHVAFRYGNGRAVPESKLKESVGSFVAGVWLRIQWRDRVRWILLELARSDELAQEHALDWVERLGLDPENCFTSEAIPEYMGFNEEKHLW